jgi:rubredoxin---NAD+ reductase
VGLRPATELAQTAGLRINRGIIADPYLQTSAPDIYTLGDCAEICGLVLPFVQPILHAARALAKTLAGEATALHYPVMPVVVKTPACPAVVCPPPQGVQGQWQESVSTGGVRALFRGEDGGLLGFALTGMETVKEQTMLAAQILPAD